MGLGKIGAVKVIITFPQVLGCKVEDDIAPVVTYLKAGAV